MLERKDIVIGSYPILGSAIESFNFWYMFVPRCDVEVSVEVGNVSAYEFKLVIHKD